MITSVKRPVETRPPSPGTLVKLKTYISAQCYLFAQPCETCNIVICYKLIWTKEADMAVSYNRLWKLLIDRKISKADLRKATGIAPNTMTKLRRDEEVPLTVLGKICDELNVDYGDILEYVKEQPQERSKEHD